MSLAYICGAVRTPFANVNGLLSRYELSDLAALPIRDMVNRNGRIDWKSIDGIFVGSDDIKLSTRAEFEEFVSELLGRSGIITPCDSRLFRMPYSSGLEAVSQGVLEISDRRSELLLVSGVGRSLSSDSRGNALLITQNQSEALWAEQANQRYLFRAMTSRLARAKDLADRFGLEPAFIVAFSKAAIKRAQDARERGWFDRECMLVPVGDKGASFFSEDELNDDAQFTYSRDDYDSPFPAGGIGYARAAEGACCILLASEGAVKRMRLTPRVRVLASRICSENRDKSGLLYLTAVEKVLEEAGLTISDIDVIEVNEVCAVEVLGFMSALEIDINSCKVNPYGGDLALGEVAGASSARLVISALNKLQADGGRYALCAASSSNGNGVAIILESQLDNERKVIR